MAYERKELGAEFWMLTQGVLQDSSVDTDEAKVIRRWLQEHGTNGEFDLVIGKLDKFLADGYIAPYESKQLIDSLGTVLRQLRA